MRPFTRGSDEGRQERATLGKQASTGVAETLFAWCVSIAILFPVARNRRLTVRHLSDHMSRQEKSWPQCRRAMLAVFRAAIRPLDKCDLAGLLSRFAGDPSNRPRAGSAPVNLRNRVLAPYPGRQ